MKDHVKLIWLVGALIIITVLILFFLGRDTGYVVKEEPIKIGAILPLSGKAASYGESSQEAIELALKEINDAGGINGREIEIIYEDSQGQPSLGVSAAKKLISLDNVKVVLGPVMSSVTLAVAPIAEENKVILVSVSSSPDITYAGDYIFRNREKATQQSEKIADFIFNNLNTREIAALYMNDDTGSAHYSSLVEYFNGLGGKILITEIYDPMANDFRTQLTKIKSVDPKVIYIAGRPKDVGSILKQANELDIDAQFIATSGSEGKEVIEIAGKAAEGLIYALPSADIKRPEVADFYKKYNEKCEICYTELGALFYDSLKIIAMVMDKCDEDTDCIKQELYSIENYSGASGKTSFDEYGDATKTVILKTIRDGEFVPYN